MQKNDIILVNDGLKWIAWWCHGYLPSFMILCI